MRLRRRMNRSVLAFRRNRRRFIPCRGQVLRRRFRITSSWIFRITHGPRSTADGPSRTFLSEEITLRLLNGGVRHLSKKRDGTGRICCLGNKMEPLEVLIHPMGSHLRVAAVPFPSRGAQKIPPWCGVSYAKRQIGNVLGSKNPISV